MTMRSVQDRFWSDGWVRKLNPLDRYLFLYLITNEHTNWAGVYELEIGMMAFESGIDRTELEVSMLPRLSPKIIYVDGWVYVPNWVKHHASESGTLSPQQKEGIRKAFEKVPEKIRLRIKEIESEGIPYVYPMDTVSPSSSSLSSSYLGANAPDFEEVVVSEETEGRPKVERRTKDKEAIYRLFSSKEQPWWRHAQQKKAALSLFDLVGVEKVKVGLGIMREHEDDPLCPQAATPFEYEEKLPKIARYAKRKGL